jgi:uncharacterized cupredoxin-like copper-binding protein
VRRAGLVLAAALAVALAAPASAGTHFVGVRTADVIQDAYILSKTRVHKGNIQFELDNSHAMDPHDLLIVKGTDNTGKPVGSVPETAAGDVADDVTIKLKPGRYYLYCDIGFHEEQGMYAKLKVVD